MEGIPYDLDFHLEGRKIINKFIETYPRVLVDTALSKTLAIRSTDLLGSPPKRKITRSDVSYSSIQMIQTQEMSLEIVKTYF